MRGRQSPQAQQDASPLQLSPPLSGCSPVLEAPSSWRGCSSALGGLLAPAVCSQPPPPPLLLIFPSVMLKSEAHCEDYSSLHVCTRKGPLLSVEFAFVHMWLSNPTFFCSPSKYAYDDPVEGACGPAGTCPLRGLPHPFLDGRGVIVGSSRVSPTGGDLPPIPSADAASCRFCRDIQVAL